MVFVEGVEEMTRQSNATAITLVPVPDCPIFMGQLIKFINWLLQRVLKQYVKEIRKSHVVRPRQVTFLHPKNQQRQEAIFQQIRGIVFAGKSNSEIARILGIDPKDLSRYANASRGFTIRTAGVMRQKLIDLANLREYHGQSAELRVIAEELFRLAARYIEPE